MSIFDSGGYIGRSSKYGSMSIVSQGLQLCLDAADRNSYPGTGNTWFDISGNGRNGTIQAGVSYNSAGFFTFNGTTNAYVSCPLVTTSNTNLTMQALVNMPASGKGAIIYNGTSGGCGYGIGNGSFDTAGNEAIVLFQMVRWVDINVNWGTGWMLTTLTMNSSSTPFLFRNTTLLGKSAGTAPNSPSANTLIGADTIGSSRTFNSNIAWVGIYNRVLSYNEINQNYSVLRTRFGF